MGWKTELLDASFRGVTFEVESVQDDGEKSIVVHEYPYRAGAEIEDLGRKARRIRVTALFWGEDYLSGVASLVKAFEEAGKGELIHPVFGSVQVAIIRWGIPHRADDPDYVALDFEAVEASLDNPFFDYQSPRAGAEQAQASLDASIADALSSTASTVRDKLAVAQEYAQAARARVENVLAAVLDIYDMGQSVVRTALSYVNYPAAFMSDLLAVQSKITSGVDPSGSFSAWTRLSDSFPRLGRTGETVKSEPVVGGVSSRVQGYVSGGVDGRAEPVLAVKKTPAKQPVPLLNAPAPGAGTVEDVGIMAATVAQTVQLAEATGGMLADELDEPSMTPQEIEAVVGNVRERVQDSIDWVRAVADPETDYAASESLRTIADAVQTLGAKVLETRPPLVEHVVETECNAHLLAHKLYGDFTRAAEIVRLNPQIRNPNFIAKGQLLNVYAD